MYLDILKNPIVLGVLAGVVTYLYMMWCNNKKYEKNPNEKKEISLVTPAVVAVIVAVVAYGYFHSSGETTAPVPQHTTSPGQGAGIVQVTPGVAKGLGAGTEQRFNFVQDVSPESPALFHLISRGVNIPNNLNVPDVFIETY